MNLNQSILKISESLMNLFERDKSTWSEITDIFSNLSQIEGLNEDLYSFCTDAMVVIGESVHGDVIYKDPTVMNYDDLKNEYKKILAELNNSN